MNASDAEYRGLCAATWDLWRDDTAGWSDRFFYLDVIREYGEPVLDLGCGTGRLILDYLAEGIDVDGVDNSAEMLAICRSKAERAGFAPTLHRQELERLELPRRYRTILGPSSVLQLLTAPGTVEACVRRLFDRLEPGGVLIASFSFEWRPGQPLETDWEPLFAKPRSEDGAVVRAWTREWREPEHRLWHTEQRFEVELDGQVVASEVHRRSPEGRWYSRDEAAQLYASVGFTGIEVYHDFTRTPATDDSTIFCVLGVRP
jgi:SAM-dependent methyltransferase